MYTFSAQTRRVGRACFVSRKLTRHAPNSSLNYCIYILASMEIMKTIKKKSLSVKKNCWFQAEGKIKQKRTL